MKNMQLLLWLTLYDKGYLADCDEETTLFANLLADLVQLIEFAILKPLYASFELACENGWPQNN